MTKEQEKKLAWVLHEYDCVNLEEAKKEARIDSNLNRLLRECGVQFNQEATNDC